jgi:hypothetical protein
VCINKRRRKGKVIAGFFFCQSMIRGREPRLFRGWQSRAPLWPPPAVVLAPSLFLLCSRSNSRKRRGMEWVGGSETVRTPREQRREAGRDKPRRGDSQPWMPSRSPTCECIAPVGPAQMMSLFYK